MLSNILVSNCPALHRINITSNSLQVRLVIKSAVFSSCHLFYSRVKDGLCGDAEISIAKARKFNHVSSAMPIFTRSGPLRV